MSDTDEGGELSPEAKAFLAQHEKTGEPTAEGLERVRQRLAAPPARSPPPVSKRRPLVAPEVWAAAAVVVLLLGAQGLYLAFRTPAAKTEQGPTPADERDTKAVVEAWRAGDYEGANRLASKECRSTSCRTLAPVVARALGFTRRLDELTEAERNELSSLERGIDEQGIGRDAGKDGAGLADASAEQLFNEGLAQKKAKNVEAAVSRFEQCIKVDPQYAACYRMLGSMYAIIATRDQSARAMESARRSYQQFLEVAPAGDEYVPKVRAILEAASGSPQRKAPELIVIPGTIKIVLGGKKTLPLPGLTRVAVGDPTIADVKVVSATDLEVTGADEGKTTLLVWLANGERKSYLIEVKALQPDEPNPDYPTDTVAVLSSSAASAKMDGNWRRVFKASQEILSIDPKHVGARGLVEDCRRFAQDTYLRGYQVRESTPEEAIRMFQLVSDITVPEDVLHQKAQNQLDALDDSL